MAPAAASGGSSLPSGFAVFITFPDLLFILEFVSGSRARGGTGRQHQVHKLRRYRSSLVVGPGEWDLPPTPLPL